MPRSRRAFSDLMLPLVTNPVHVHVAKAEMRGQHLSKTQHGLTHVCCTLHKSSTLNPTTSHLTYGGTMRTCATCLETNKISSHQTATEQSASASTPLRSLHCPTWPKVPLVTLSKR